MVVRLDDHAVLDIRNSYDIPGQRRKKDTPLGILQKRFATGEITTEEYHEKKKILESGLA